MSNYGRPPPRIDGMVSLKVDNLTYRTTPEDLRRVFERCGEVGDIYIPRDRFTRESRGFAFVRFYDKRDAEDALEAMDGRMLDGRELRVQMARYGRPTSPQTRRNGGGRRDRDRRDHLAIVVVLEAVLAVVAHFHDHVLVRKVNLHAAVQLARCTKKHRSVEVAARDVVLVVALAAVTAEINQSNVLPIIRRVRTSCHDLL